MSGFKIKEFPQDGACWRIDWLGKIRPNIDVESEPTIDVLLTKLQDGYTDPLSNSSLTVEQISAAIGIGQLPLLRAGSVWKDKQLHTYLQPDLNNKKLATFEIDTSQELRHAFNDSLTVDGEAFSLMPRSYYRVGKHYPNVADAPLAVFPGNGHSLDYFIIPRFELLRFYYINSSKLAYYVWEDAIGQAINQHKSAQLADNDVRIHLRRDMMDKDAYLIARWFVSDKMRQEISSFRNKRSTAAANLPKHESVAIHPDIGFPFSGKATLRALGKRIKLHTSESTGREVWAFLALHVLHCAHPMPYRDLIVDRDNRNIQGKNRDDPDLLPAWAQKQRNEPREDGGNSGTTLASDEEPNKDLRAKTIELFEQQFDLQKHRLVKEEVEVQKYKSVKVERSGESFVDQYGTGEGTFGESGTGPANASTSPLLGSERHLVTLMPFIESLRWIRKQLGGSVETLALGGEHMLVAGEIAYLLPEVIKGMRSWHRIKSDPPRSRGIMVAKVALPGQTFYLIEIERKDKGESFSTLVMKSHISDLPDSHLRDFLRVVARTNGWPKQGQEGFRHFEFRGVNHDKEDTAEKFGERLMTAAKIPHTPY